MNKLYKGKYLFAIYDKDDNFVYCSENIRDIAKYCCITYDTLYQEISRGTFFGKKYRNYQLYLINCLEKHDDVFKYEDEIFLKEANLCTKKEDKYEQLAEKYGKSLRTIYRLIANRKLNIKSINEL